MKMYSFGFRFGNASGAMKRESGEKPEQLRPAVWGTKAREPLAESWEGARVDRSRARRPALSDSTFCGEDETVRKRAPMGMRANCLRRFLREKRRFFDMFQIRKGDAVL